MARLYKLIEKINKHAYIPKAFSVGFMVLTQKAIVVVNDHF